MCPVNEHKSHCYSGHLGTKRLGVMHVSYPLILEMLPPGKVIDCVADKIGADADWLAKIFDLPANAKITGVSMSYRFMNNQVSLRIECPDFVETQEVCVIPEVEARYGQGELAGGIGGRAKFLHWIGPAVSTVGETEPRAPITCNACRERQAVPGGDGKCGPCWAKEQL